MWKAASCFLSSLELFYLLFKNLFSSRKVLYPKSWYVYPKLWDICFKAWDIHPKLWDVKNIVRNGDFLLEEITLFTWGSYFLVVDLLSFFSSC